MKHRSEVKDKYRIEQDKDVYSDDWSSYSHEYVKWLEEQLIDKNEKVTISDPKGGKG